jgi:hypothetical protein
LPAPFLSLLALVLQAEVARLRELTVARPAPAERRSKQRTRQADGE